MGAAIRTTKYQGMCNCHFQAPLEVQNIKGQHYNSLLGQLIFILFVLVKYNGFLYRKIGNTIWAQYVH
jgi:hypothetical protein